MSDRAVLCEINRFPVKSMLGETLSTAEVTTSGIVGDRGWALVDVETGKVASAKHPRLWDGLLNLRARYIDATGPGAAVRIDTADGTTATSTDPAVDTQLSAMIGRHVRLEAAPRSDASYDAVWPDIPGVAPEEFIAATRSGSTSGSEDISSLPVGILAPGTFHDFAAITIMTTSSLRTAARMHPAGDWDPRRFRSTLLVDIEEDGFAEQRWIGRRVHIGDVALDVAIPIPRCVMTTLAQQELSKDPKILHTLAKHNRLDVAGTGRFACLGVYATVAQPGRITLDQTITLS
ncbi:MAG: MOSC domain-containing protein [Sciscionella sp.]